MRVGRLGRDPDVGAISGGPKRDRQADAAACTRDKERFSS
jgi:hypothetical protein